MQLVLKVSQTRLTIEDFIELSRRRVHHKVSCNADLKKTSKITCHITFK